VPQGYSVTKRVLDRLLAAGSFEKPSPAQRPFDSDAVMGAFGSSGKTTASGKGGTGTLVLSGQGGSDPVLLRPSISQLGTNPVGDGMTITGNFGTDPVTVTVGGQTVMCGAPNADGTIIDHCMVPSGTYGDVVVSADTVKSPPRPLSRWQPTLHFTAVGPGTFTTDIKVMLDFRGDVLKFRSQPEQAPDQNLLWTGFYADMMKTSCTITMSGSYNGCTQSGGVTLPYSGTLPQCYVQVAFDPSNPAMPLQFQVFVNDQGAGTVTCSGAPPQPIGASTNTPLGFADSGTNMFFAAVDPTTGAISSRTVGPTSFGPIRYTMSWITTQPLAPTSDQTAR